MNITNIVLSAFLAFGQPVAKTREIVRYAGVQAIHADGCLTLRMSEPVRTERAEAGARHVVLVSRDEAYPFFLTRHVVFRDDCDVAETWVEIRHEEEGPVRLVRTDSFAAELPVLPQTVDVLTLAGINQTEARIVESRLAPGQTLATSSREGIHNAFESNPAMMVSLDGATETEGAVLGVALEWTGCSAKSVRREYDGRTKVFIGVDHQGGPYVLEPNVTLTTPRAMLVLSRKGKGEVSRQFHRWAHRHLMPHGDALHPVLLNSWEGSYFSFTEKTLTDMMDGVKEMGGEMFVLDDGWFGRGPYARDEINKDTSGLGDWVVNDRKLPHGLGWLADQAKARGLKFGLWVEPEMVNTNSALCTAHPDWMQQEPRRRTLLGRGKSQNTLDLCNPAVRDNLFAQIDAVYSTVPGLAYVKWDANGSISNLGSPYLPRDRQGNLWFDYTTGLYDLLARFQAKRPHVMTQACASGGGHMDFGFLRYADEFWTSDRTDPVSRIWIQWGCSQFYPASAMACHVTASPNHQTKRETPLRYRFDVAMSGRLGFELHPKDLTADELDYAKARVEQYKRIRPTVQQGDLYRLASPYEHPYAALSYVSADRARAVVFAYGLDKPLDETVALRLDGLDPERSYVVRGERRTGADLMRNGLAVVLKGRYASEVVELAPASDRPLPDKVSSGNCGGEEPAPCRFVPRRYATFASERADGRYGSTRGAVHEMVRTTKPALAFDPLLSPEAFVRWRGQVKDKLLELLAFPDLPPARPPKRLSHERRDGYTLERWEHYPMDKVVVPYLVLVPDGVSAERPAPAVLCLPGTSMTKESSVGEPELNPVSAIYDEYVPENRMALQYCRAGFVAVAVDNPGVGETADLERVVGGRARHLEEIRAFGHHLLNLGWSYMGYAAYVNHRLLERLRLDPRVDRTRIALSGHSLGAWMAGWLTVLNEDIAAVVVNQGVYRWQEAVKTLTRPNERGGSTGDPGHGRILLHSGPLSLLGHARHPCGHRAASLLQGIGGRTLAEGDAGPESRTTHFKWNVQIRRQ